MEERQRGHVLSPTSPGPNSDAWRSQRHPRRAGGPPRHRLATTSRRGWVWEAAETLEEALFAQYPKGSRRSASSSWAPAHGWLALRLACCGAYVRATDRGERLGLLLRNIAANERRFAAAGRARASSGSRRRSSTGEEAEIELDADGLPVGVPVGDARKRRSWWAPTSSTCTSCTRRCSSCSAGSPAAAPAIFLSWEERKPKEEASFLELAKVAGFACSQLLRQTRDGGFVAWDRSASGERTLVAYEFKLSKGKPDGKATACFPAAARPRRGTSVGHQNLSRCLLRTLQETEVHLGVHERRARPSPRSSPAGRPETPASRGATRATPPHRAGSSRRASARSSWRASRRA